MTEYYGNNDYRDYLMHYGVLGMRWGVRRYQPYSVRGRKSGKGGKEIGEAKRAGKSPKKSGDYGVIVPVGLVTFYSIYIATMLGIVAADKYAVARKKKFVEKCDKERKEATEVDKKTGFKKQVTPKDPKENLKRVNPRIGTTSHDWNTKSNCVNCTHTYEMRRRGLEVQAKLSSHGKDGIELTKKLYKNPKLVESSGHKEFFSKDESEREEWSLTYAEKAAKGRNIEHAKSVVSDLKKCPPGSRGQLLVNWSNWGGHSLNYEILPDGKLEVQDGQVNKIYNEKAAEKLFARTIAVGYIRLDNLEVKSKKSLGDCMK